MGQSTIPSSYDFTSATAAEDLKGVLDFLSINQTYIVAHDKGNGQAAALNAKYRSLVKRAVYSEYALPGFGYEKIYSPELGVSGLYLNWQLAFFSVPDAAQYFIQGQEKQMLAWYFWHSSYSGNSVISQDLLERYTREISKAGYLRSGLEYFNTTEKDAVYFNSTLGVQPLENPALVLGGESSFAPLATIEGSWGPILANPSYDIVPKAGHWLGMIFETPVVLPWMGADINQGMKILNGLRTGFSASWLKIKVFHPWTFHTLRIRSRWFESTH